MQLKKLWRIIKGLFLGLSYITKLKNTILALEPLKNGRLGLEGYYTERLEIVKPPLAKARSFLTKAP